MKSRKEMPYKMAIAVGSDHGGFGLKKDIIDFLTAWHYKVKDFGTKNEARCDYPPVAYKVASAVMAGEFERGILICKSGIGMCIAANKVNGIRAAFLTDSENARLSREHNDANIAIFSGKSMTISKAKKILDVWLSADFEGGRHFTRVKQIKQIEQKMRRRCK
ncbi:MAG: ribose 5-phosphate isomerase B [Candidatus Omnitrophica bacterium]|nr:ribose 5-phosphate isomerase B [Candidatus Omnitrophota bacterium]